MDRIVEQVQSALSMLKVTKHAKTKPGMLVILAEHKEGIGRYVAMIVNEDALDDDTVKIHADEAVAVIKIGFRSNGVFL